MHLLGMDYKYFSPHCCKCNSCGCMAAIRFGNACHGPHSDSLYSGSELSQFNSPRLVKREAGFHNPRWALIGSNQLWCVNDSPYYWEYGYSIVPHFFFRLIYPDKISTWYYESPGFIRWLNNGWKKSKLLSEQMSGEFQLVYDSQWWCCQAFNSLRPSDAYMHQ